VGRLKRGADGGAVVERGEDHGLTRCSCSLGEDDNDGGKKGEVEGVRTRGEDGLGPCWATRAKKKRNQ
jgi:hypothetical protein